MQEPRGQAAGWQISGRVISLLEAALTLARAGFATELVPTLRTVHEANQLLRAVANHKDTSILRAWLQGQHVKPARVLAAENRFQKAVAAKMRAAGVSPPGRTHGYMAELYKFLSEMAHVRRSRVLEIIGEQSRFMPIGPHPDARLRGAFVYYTGVYVMDSTAAVGFALGTSLGGWAVERTQNAFNTLNALLKDVPLDPASIRGT